MTSNFYAIILAGGSGERLWPLSRGLFPKQLLPWTDSSLLALTLDRIAPLIPKEQRMIVTTSAQQHAIEQAVGTHVQTVLGEPAARNTAAAVAWACLTLSQKNPNAIAIILSADHYIPDQTLFLQDIKKAVAYAQEHNVIALLGIQPTHPATGYGYIEYAKNDAHALKKVTQFHEKPSLTVAQTYLNAGNFLWNTGMFCGKVSTFLDEFKKHAPGVLDHVQAFMQGTAPYEATPKISFDHAVMEKSNATVVLPASFEWKDVGNLDIFLSLQNKTQEQNKNVYALNAHNNLVNATDPKKIIALIGVDDLCIVNTKDALLIAKRSDVEEVKAIVQQLRVAGNTEVL
ncbi:MAG: mannose-1-phosphate guanylyltransferase [Candidatus Babeliales bacterium]